MAFYFWSLEMQYMKGMVRPVKTSELLSLLLSEGRAPSQNCADININYYQKRQYTASSSALALCREALTPFMAYLRGWRIVSDSRNIAQGNSRREFCKAVCSAMFRGKKKVNIGPNLTLDLAWVYTPDNFAVP